MPTAVFVSRFGNDWLMYSHNRGGWTAAAGSLRTQVYWNGNLTTDSRREYWANFVEMGPGLRLRGPLMPRGSYVTVDLMRGAYLINAGNPRGPNFNDVRAGMWYAFTY